MKFKKIAKFFDIHKTQIIQAGILSAATIALGFGAAYVTPGNAQPATQQTAKQDEKKADTADTSTDVDGTDVPSEVIEGEAAQVQTVTDPALAGVQGTENTEQATAAPGAAASTGNQAQTTGNNAQAASGSYHASGNTSSVTPASSGQNGNSHQTTASNSSSSNTGSSSKGNSGSSNASNSSNNGGSGNSGNSGNSNSGGSNNSSSSQKPVHQHQWEEQMENYTVKVVDKAAYTEKVKIGAHVVCNQCGKDFGNNESSSEEAGWHSVETGHNYTTKPIYQEVYHQEEYHMETHTRGTGHYKCKTCGATK